MFLKRRKAVERTQNWLKIALHASANLYEHMVKYNETNFHISESISWEKKKSERKLWLLCKTPWLLPCPVSPLQCLGPYSKMLLGLMTRQTTFLINTAQPQSLRRERKIKLLSSVWKLVCLGTKSDEATVILGWLSLRAGPSWEEGCHGSKSPSWGCVAANLQPGREGPTLTIPFHEHWIP